jgi:hypothetical protein
VRGNIRKLSNFRISDYPIHNDCSRRIVRPNKAITMQQSAPDSQYTATSDQHTVVSRRNLPRASHACRWCRLKKARCDQKQPCVNCLKHSVDCTYDVRRRNRRKASSRTQDENCEDTTTRHGRLSSQESVPRTRDELHVTSRPRRFQGHSPANTRKPLHLPPIL